MKQVKTRNKQTFGEGSIIIVQKFFAIEWNKALKNTIANSASANSSHYFAFQIESVSSNLRNLPITAFNHLNKKVRCIAALTTTSANLVGRNEIPDEDKNGHDNMFCDGNNVRARHLNTRINQCSMTAADFTYFQNLDTMIHSSIQIDVVRPYTCSDAEFELGGLVRIRGQSRWSKNRRSPSRPNRESGNPDEREW